MTLAISLEPNEVGDGAIPRHSARRNSGNDRAKSSRQAEAPQVMPAPAPAAPGGSPSQPPFGSTPATGSTPNKGYEAAGLQKLGVVVKQLESMLPELGASSEAGQAVLKALTSLTKFVPAGSVTPAAQKNSIEAQQRAHAQQNQQMQALQQRGGGGAPGGGQPQPQGAVA